jgi:hypothetical protein
MIVNETRDIVADVEDEPNRSESRDAVKINLHEVSHDVSIEKSHGNSEFRFAIAELQLGFRPQLAVIPSMARNLWIIGFAGERQYSEMFRFAQHDSKIKAQTISS